MLTLSGVAELNHNYEKAKHYLEILAETARRFVSIHSMPHNKSCWFEKLDGLGLVVEALYGVCEIESNPSMSPKEANDIYELAGAAEAALIDLKYYSSGIDKSREGIARSGIGKDVNESLLDHIEAVKKPLEKIATRYLPGEPSSA